MWNPPPLDSAATVVPWQEGCDAYATVSGATDNRGQSAIDPAGLGRHRCRPYRVPAHVLRVEIRPWRPSICTHRVCMALRCAVFRRRCPMAQVLRPNTTGSLFATDGKAHPVQDTFLVVTLVLGITAFVTAMFSSLHLISSWAGLVGIITGAYGQYISVTTR